jgi:hypothetical protein
VRLAARSALTAAAAGGLNHEYGAAAAWARCGEATPYPAARQPSV